MPKRKLLSLQWQRLHGFLIETRDNMADYHARKENMAWVATTVYLGGLVAVMNVAIKDNHLVVATPLFRCSLVLLILLTALSTFLFVRKQLGDRITAALIIGACGDVLGQLVDPSFTIRGPLLHVHEWCQLDHSFKFPQILIERLNARSEKASWLPSHYFATYLAITIWTIASLALVFLI